MEAPVAALLVRRNREMRFDDTHTCGIALPLLTRSTCTNGEEAVQVRKKKGSHFALFS